ncbi:MAG: outer membrane protein assembly factor BamD [Proteobacteria bacterium]|nr:outer membrane protein assembly factor BamD [Pseudomonadota bacterium]
MQRPRSEKRALDTLKRSYDETEIPGQVRHRIYSNLDDLSFRQEKTRHPALSLGIAVSALVAMVVLASYLDWFRPTVPSAARETDTEQTYAAVISEFNGSVSVNSVNDGARKAHARMSIIDDSSIQTMGSGSVKLSVGPHKAKIDPHSVFRLDSLKKDRLRFSLEQGKVKMSVAPLNKRSALIVISNGLTIEVIGTAFVVEHLDLCSFVAVSQGKVKTTFRNQVDMISAGESRSFCEKPQPKVLDNKPMNSNKPTSEQVETKDPHLSTLTSNKIALEDTHKKELKRKRRSSSGQHVSVNTAKTNDAIEDIQKPSMKDIPIQEDERRQSHVDPESISETEAHREKEPEPVEAQVTEINEELLYKSALDSLFNGNGQSALSGMMRYLEHYPNGMFAEDALFNVVRVSYASKNMEDVARWGGRFLKKYPASGRHSLEVRIFYAQSIIELGRETRYAFNTLKPVISQINRVPRQYRGQAVYLYFHAAYRSGHKDISSNWAEQYLKRFPQGRYADEAQKVLTKGEKKNDQK